MFCIIKAWEDIQGVTPGRQAVLVDQYNKDKDGKSAVGQRLLRFVLAFKGWEYSIVMHTCYVHLEPPPTDSLGTYKEQGTSMNLPAVLQIIDLLC